MDRLLCFFPHAVKSWFVCSPFLGSSVSVRRQVAVARGAQGWSGRAAAEQGVEAREARREAAGSGFEGDAVAAEGC
jgi:hypothetical protein